MGPVAEQQAKWEDKSSPWVRIRPAFIRWVLYRTITVNTGDTVLGPRWALNEELLVLLSWSSWSCPERRMSRKGESKGGSQDPGVQTGKEFGGEGGH